MAVKRVRRHQVEDNKDHEDENQSSSSSEDEDFTLTALDESESESNDGSESDAESVSTSVLNDLDNIQLNGITGSDSDDGDTLYEIGADGKPRELRPEINPIYDSDDTDNEEAGNTIGNIPISAYDEMPHIGYDIDGKRIMRPATASAIDSLLESIDLPEGWTGLIDKNTGKSLNISSDELDLIRKLQLGQNTDSSVNPFQDTVEYFTSQVELMPLKGGQEPKRRFVPSKNESKMVMKLVRAIRQGKIVPWSEAEAQKRKQLADEEQAHMYDVWADADTEPGPDHIMNLRAPKLPPPTHAFSYNPPEEYLSESDNENENEENEENPKFKSKKYDSLRKVPGYSESVRERFERSLDLYLAPRVRKPKMDMDADSLIPDLPSPKDLRPFPIKNSTIYSGHQGRVRCVEIDPTGEFVATGGDDGTVRVWELLTGKELWRCDIAKMNKYRDEDEEDEDEDSDEEALKNSQNSDSDKVDALNWHPSADTGLLAVVAGDNIYLVVPQVFYIEKINRGRELIESGWGFAEGGKDNSKVDQLGGGDDEGEDDDEEYVKKKVYAKWTKPSTVQNQKGIGAVIRCQHTLKKINWHRRGDYFVTVAPGAKNSAVLVHQLSKHASQSPFKRSRGIAQDAKFHPFRPHLYVASQRYVRVYDLSAQIMAKKLTPGVKWLNSFDIHPRGDNVITSSYDKKVTWQDMDLSTKPYKTLRYHEKAVRDVKFHKQLPLFCSASDDGQINIFHGSVYDDLMKNPLLVPLKVLRGHAVKQHLGVLSANWHPSEAWLVTAGADGTARLWVA